MRSLRLLLLGAYSPLLGSAATILQRSVSQGWSLQSTTCPSGTNSCGGGACCPSIMHCFAAQTDEVASCCSTNSACVGAIESAPKCADSAWSLWQGLQSNKFCCEVGMIGVYDSSGQVAGTCVSSGAVGTLTSASILSTGTGVAATTSTTGASTTTTAAQSTSTSTSTTAQSSSTPARSSPAGGQSSTKASTSTGTQSSTSTASQSTSTKAVFAHYMVGTMTSAEAVTDVQDALNAGFDGFALNTQSIQESDAWVTNSLNYLFDAAAGTDFKLLISFDMNTINGVTGLAAFLAPYAKNDAYYKVDDKAFVSTFHGGKSITNSEWDSGFIQPLKSTYGITPYFVPNFDDRDDYPTAIFDTFPILDGVFSWEAAWPTGSNTVANVSDSVDSAALEQARTAGKAYIMPLSTFQFKYLGNGEDYYRIGDDNLPQRMGQILDLQPDFVEVITWNDAGEGHYVGNFWQEQITDAIRSYANGFDHKGWLEVITPFITAFKAGATSISDISPPSNSPVGTLWYRPLLTSADCSSSITNYQSGQDTVNFAVILPSTGYTIKVYSNNKVIATLAGEKGLNYNSVLGLAAGGGQMLQILDSSNNVVASATGTKEVLTQSTNATCNWNYEVVGLS